MKMRDKSEYKTVCLELFESIRLYRYECNAKIPDQFMKDTYRGIMFDLYAEIENMMKKAKESKND